MKKGDRVIERQRRALRIGTIVDIKALTSRSGERAFDVATVHFDGDALPTSGVRLSDLHLAGKAS